MKPRPISPSPSECMASNTVSLSQFWCATVGVLGCNAAAPMAVGEVAANNPSGGVSGKVAGGCLHRHGGIWIEGGERPRVIGVLHSDVGRSARPRNGSCRNDNDVRRSCGSTLMSRATSPRLACRRRSWRIPGCFLVERCDETGTSWRRRLRGRSGQDQRHH